MASRLPSDQFGDPPLREDDSIGVGDRDAGDRSDGIGPSCRPTGNRRGYKFRGGKRGLGGFEAKVLEILKVPFHPEGQPSKIGVKVEPVEINVIEN